MSPMRSALLLLIATLACTQPSGPLLWQQGAVKVLAEQTREVDPGYAEVRLEVTDGNAIQSFTRWPRIVPWFLWFPRTFSQPRSENREHP